MFKRSMQLLLIGSLGTAAVWGADDPAGIDLAAVFGS